MRHKGRAQGFTLIEVMLSLALSTMTLWAIYQLYLFQVRTHGVREQILDMQQRARATIDLLCREIRMAGYDPRGVNRDHLKGNDFLGVSYDTRELHIKADLNGNGVPSDANESVEFSYDPDAMVLRRSTGGGRQPLGEYIEEFRVKYFDRTGAETTISAEIRQVEISITARTENPDPGYPLNDGYRRFTLTSRVTLRNLVL